MSQSAKRSSDASDSAENVQRNRRPSIVRRSSYSEKVEITREKTDGGKDKPESDKKKKKKPSRSQEKVEPPKRQRGSEERIEPRYSQSEIKNVKSAEGYYEKEPIQIERRRSITKDVDGPDRAEGYYEKEPIKIERRRSITKNVEAPEGYYEKEPIKVERRRSISKNVDSEPSYYEEHKPKQAAENKERPGGPCKPCSAEGGFHRVEVRVIKSEDGSETDDESSVKLCDNKFCPNKGGFKKTYGVRKKTTKITSRQYDGDDRIYLCDNAGCSERSSTDLPGKLALCGKNKGDTAKVIEFCGNNLRLVGSTKKKGYEDAQGSSRNRKKTSTTICLNDPEILEQLSRCNFKNSEVDIRRDASKVEITEVGSDKKFIIHLNPSQQRSEYSDDLETTSSHRWSGSRRQSVCYCIPDSYSVHHREDETNQGGLSALLILLIILALVYLYFPSVPRYFC